MSELYITPLEAIMWIARKEWLVSYTHLNARYQQEDIFFGVCFSSFRQEGIRKEDGKKYPYDIGKDRMLIFAKHLAEGKEWTEDEWNEICGFRWHDVPVMSKCLKEILSKHGFSLPEFIDKLQASIAYEKDQCDKLYLAEQELLDAARDEKIIISGKKKKNGDGNIEPVPVGFLRRRDFRISLLSGGDKFVPTDRYDNRQAAYQIDAFGWHELQIRKEDVVGLWPVHPPAEQPAITDRKFDIRLVDDPNGIFKKILQHCWKSDLQEFRDVAVEFNDGDLIKVSKAESLLRNRILPAPLETEFLYWFRNKIIKALLPDAYNEYGDSKGIYHWLSTFSRIGFQECLCSHKEIERFNPGSTQRLISYDDLMERWGKLDSTMPLENRKNILRLHVKAGIIKCITQDGDELSPISPVGETHYFVNDGGIERAEKEHFVSPAPLPPPAVFLFSKGFIGLKEAWNDTVKLLYGDKMAASLTRDEINEDKNARITGRLELYESKGYKVGKSAIEDELNKPVSNSDKRQQAFEDARLQLLSAFRQNELEAVALSKDNEKQVILTPDYWKLEVPEWQSFYSGVVERSSGAAGDCNRYAGWKIALEKEPFKKWLADKQTLEEKHTLGNGKIATASNAMRVPLLKEVKAWLSEAIKPDLEAIKENPTLTNKSKDKYYRPLYRSKFPEADKYSDRMFDDAWKNDTVVPAKWKKRYAEKKGGKLKKPVTESA